MRITYEHELEELNKCLRDMAMMVELYYGRRCDQRRPECK